MLKRILVNELAVRAADRTTSYLKEEVNRTRPNGKGTDSFSSGHATRAFSAAGVNYFNVMDNRELHAFPRYSLATLGYGFAYATAWGRVEAGKHYPSDVLAGAAIGNFFATFLHELFLSKKTQRRYRTQISVAPLEDGYFFNYRQDF